MQDHHSYSATNNNLQAEIESLRQAAKTQMPIVPKKYRKAFEARRLETNVNRMFGFAIFITLFQVVLQVVNIAVPQKVGNGMPLPLDCWIGLSLITLILGIIFWIIFGMMRRGHLNSSLLKRVSIQTLVYSNVCIQLAFCTINILSNQGLNSFIFFLAMFSTIPVLPRRQSAITISLAFVYITAIMALTQGIQGTTISAQGTEASWTINSLAGFLYSDTRAALPMLTGISIFISINIYNLYARSFLSSLATELYASDLEKLISKRTAALEKKTVALELALLAKSRFLTNMSHELRTPLNVIIGMTQVAGKAVDNNEPAKARNSLAEVSSSSQRLLEMLNDVLDISNIEEGRLYLKEERFLLHETMLDTAQAVADKATEKNQHFTNNIAMLPKIWVIGDKMRLKQVLVNLLENAIEFTPAKGKISFEVNCQHEDENRARFAFTITDNGVGIASERIPTLFEFFANDTGASYDNGNDGSAGRNGNGSAGRNGGGGAGHNSGGGAGHNGGGGFGLAISKYLVGAMGGQIDVSSALGMGSVFSFILSFDKATGDGKLNTDLPTVVPDLTGRRILSVEDIEINRLVLRELLAETQVTIEEAEDGLEAIERFRKSPVGYYDLVFMDLLMPRMGGHEAAREIRNLNRADAKTIPIVAISANAYDSDKHKSLAAGMNEHLAKPIDYAAALDVLSKYVVQTPRDLTSASS